MKNKNPKLINFFVSFEVLGSHVEIYIGDWVISNDLIKKRYKLDKDFLRKGIDGNGSSIIDNDTGIINYVLWIDELKPDDPKSIGNMVHECFHIVDFMMKNINTDLTDNCYEIHAYYLGWLVEQILEKYKKITKGKKNGRR